MIVDKERKCMVWEFSHHDCDECFARNGFLRSFSSKKESRWSCPSSIGRGEFTKMQIREGFELWITDCSLDHEVLCNQKSHSTIHFGFFLEGHFTGRWENGHVQFILRTGDHYLFFGQEIECNGIMAPGIDQLCISFTISPELMLSYFDEEDSKFSKMLQEIVHYYAFSDPFIRVQSMTSEMYVALRQILQCPYTGATRKLYLESRALELIAHQLQQFNGTESLSDSCSSGNLHPSEKVRIEQVRQLLLDKIDDPPHLDGLAEIAGMSHPKLNRCFRRLYGKTVFQYLRDERLKKARLLIENQGRTVTEAAYLVGYSSLSHFSKAYKHHYGISPGNKYRGRKTA